MSLTAGDKLGPYEILGSAGSGGMGEVYRARDTRLDRLVAIKVSREEFSQRFKHEARAVGALNHPHICQLYDVGPNYLVMEFVEGTSLKGPLRLERAVEYAGQILDALDAAHRKGITHRDLKPANILVTKEGIKLVDFGLAKQCDPLKEADATQTAALTATGQIVGTLQYMSPEQLQGKQADARSDLFSFGCVLYEMLMGERAFVGQSAASVIAAILEREPAPLEEAPQLERVVRRSLAKDPDQRFQTARDLKAALTWALEQPSVTRPDRGRWIAAAALLVLVAGGWAVLRLRQAPAEQRAFRFEINPPQNGRFVLSGNFVGGFAISVDGNTAAYVASVNGKSGLWVRPIEGTVARLLPGTEGAASPFWLPDNKSIVFLAGRKLQRTNLAGGMPVAICDGASIRGGSVDSDGHILFGTAASGLFRVSASGGVPTPMTTLNTSQGEYTHRWPQVIPGGRFLYLALGTKPESNGVYAASLAKPGERVRLFTADSNAVYVPDRAGLGYLLWRRGGALVAQEFDPETLKFAGDAHQIAETVSGSPQGQMNVTASASGMLLYSALGASTQFTWFDRTGKLLGVVGEPGEYRLVFHLSPDGRRIVAQRTTAGSVDVWLLETERGLSSRLTYSEGFSSYPIWSPDGRTILLSRLGSHSLFRKVINRPGDEQLVIQRPSDPFTTDWSIDGRWVLDTESSPSTNYDLWILPVTPEGKLQGGAQPRPYLRTPSSEAYGRFSPEPSPRWVAFMSDESGRDEVYVDAFPEPRGKVQVSTAGGRYPQWGGGGRELFYVSPDYKLMAVSLKPGTNSLDPSAPRQLFALPVLGALLIPYEAARDGQRFLVLAEPEQAAQPLTVIVNWPALVKKRAAAP